MAGNTPVDGEGASIVLGVGVAGMQERLRQLGGRLHVESSDKGTAVSAFFPCKG